MRHSFGLTTSSLRLRSTRFTALRASSLLLGVSLAAGALLVAPHTPSAWAAPIVGGDENGPKVQIVSPAYQDVLKGRSRILVAVKVTQYNPSTIQLFLDDKPASNMLPLSAFTSSSFDWDTRLTADGQHKLSVRVTDTQGFRGWAEVSVYVNNQNVRDTVAPDLNWTNVDKFQQLSGQAKIQLEAKDNFGVKWIIVSLNPVSKSTQQPAQRSWLLDKPPYNFNLDTTKVADGLYSLSARAWDSMEQEGKSQTLTIGIANSPVNATTVAESLDALKAMAKVQTKQTPAPAAAPQPKANGDKALAVSGSGKAATAKTPGNTASSIPEGYILVPKVTLPQKGAQTPASSKGTATVKPRATAPTVEGNGVGVEIARNSGSSEAAPTLSAPSVRLGEAAPATAPAPTTGAAGTEESATRVARLSQPELGARAETAPSATLSSASSGDVLVPSISGGVQMGEVKGSDPVLVARLNAPEMATRRDTDFGSAALSRRELDTASALAPARNPEVAVTTQERVDVARLAAPKGLDGSGQRVSGPSKVVLRQPHQRQPHVVTKVADKTVGTKTPETVVAELPEAAPSPAPQLSQPKLQSESLAQPQTKVPVAETAPAPRIAALPKVGPVEVAPSVTMAHPVITVSPVKVAFDKSLPTYHQARHLTTLRAVAEHYGMPVELVASANNWTTDMKVLPGMKVQLPRQVQLSYNGQKLRGDVTSLMAGDTTFTGMRFLFEHTGGTISWDAAKQEVVARKGKSTVRVKIGSSTATVNNKTVMMQLAAFLFEGRTMVPARFFEEGLDAQVEWNPETGRLVVAMAN